MMEHGSNKEEQALLQKALRDARNHQRLSTLKLWQLHIQSLSTPKSQPLLKRYRDDYDVTEMHTISESTIISSDEKQTRIRYIQDDDQLPMSDIPEQNIDE